MREKIKGELVFLYFAFLLMKETTRYHFNLVLATEFTISIGHSEKRLKLLF